MAYPKMWAIRCGDRLVTYGGFACIPVNSIVTVEEDAQGLFFVCADGHHFGNARFGGALNHVGQVLGVVWIIQMRVGVVKNGHIYFATADRNYFERI